ncbi:MAG: PTS galactitol transporter subunit IIB [Sporolactobacillus sp.]
MKKLIVACGSGVATSTTVEQKIKRLLEENDVQGIQTEAVDYKRILEELPSTDIYVYIAQPDSEVLNKAKELGVSVFPGIPFLVGAGQETVLKEIIEQING